MVTFIPYKVRYAEATKAMYAVLAGTTLTLYKEKTNHVAKVTHVSCSMPGNGALVWADNSLVGAKHRLCCG